MQVMANIALGYIGIVLLMIGENASLGKSNGQSERAKYWFIAGSLCILPAFFKLFVYVIFGG